MKFNLGSGAALSRIGLALGKVYAGEDLIVSLQGDSGGHPSGTPLVGCFLPADWLASGVQTGQGLWTIPLPYTLAGSTPYYVVLTPASAAFGSGAYAQGAPNVNDVELTRSTAGTGAQTYNPLTATWTAQSYGYLVYLRGGLGGPIACIADDSIPSLAYAPPSKVASYAWTGSVLNNTFLWAAHSLAAPFNILCRDDAGFESSTGTFAGTNCILSQSSNYALSGTYSLAMLTTPGGTMSATTATGTSGYVVSGSTTYTAVAGFNPGTATARNISIGVAWYTSGGTLISTSTGTSYTEVSGSWVQANVIATSPSNAAYAAIICTVTSAAASEVHYVDCVQLQAGSGTIWSYPSSGIGSTRTLTYTSGVLTSIA
jgi:hypothetical protein